MKKCSIKFDCKNLVAHSPVEKDFYELKRADELGLKYFAGE